MWRKIPLGILALATLAQAVVIAPPVVYWVTLSLSTFVANMLVTLFMYAAVRGFASKKLFGKSMAEIFGFVFSMIGKFIIAMIASLVALIWISPISFPEILIASLIALLISLAVSFLAEYREFRVSGSPSRALLSITLFSILVAGLTFVSAFYALQTQVIVADGSREPVPAVSLAPSMGLFTPSQSSAPAMMDEVRDTDDYEMQKSDSTSPATEKKDTKTIRIIPISDAPCTVSSKDSTETFIPEFTCVAGEGLSQRRIYCPVIAQVNGDYKTGGSCA
jgi:hypothetical protein